MNESLFSSLDFGPLKEFLENDDVTDISYSNNGQVWVRTLSKGIFRVERPDVNNALMEKLAFQCSNVMGTTFNMAHPFLDAESAELRLNFVHNSIAKNGIAAVLRKTPAKIRLEHEKILAEQYITEDIHQFLVECVHGHCNIIVSGETGSGKTELVKYLASKTKEDEKIITIEDTLELHLDRIFPHRDIVAMKTNNIASYSDVLVTCMRQNPKWILLSEVRSAEAVSSVRNSISSGHNILSTIHSDKAESIPSRMYSLLESNVDIEQFLKSIYRYVQLGVHVRGFQDPKTKRFHREVSEVTEFYVTDENEAKSNTIYRKAKNGQIFRKNPSRYLLDYLAIQGVDLTISKVAEKEDGTMTQIASNYKMTEVVTSQGGQPQAVNPVQGPQPQVANPVQGPQPQVANPVQGPQPQAVNPVQGPQPQVANPVQGPQPQVVNPVQGPQPQVVNPVQGPQPQVANPVQGPQFGATNVNVRTNSLGMPIREDEQPSVAPVTKPQSLNPFGVSQITSNGINEN